MAKIVFDTSSPNDGLGTELRNAFIGVNSNFTELYDNKVDKETGKGLSTNDYTDAERDKLAGIEEGAQVNVPINYADLIGAPTITNYANTIGFFDYNNSNTTPLTLVANVEKNLTNDCVGAYTDISHPTYGVTRLFDPTTNNIVLNELGVGDLVKLRVDINVTTATANQNYKCILRLGIGTSKEFEIVIHEEQVKDTGLHKKTIYTGFYIGSDEVRTSLGELVLLSDHAGSVVINGFFFEAVKRNVNFVELSGGGGSQDLQQTLNNGATATFTHPATNEVFVINEVKDISIGYCSGKSITQSDGNLSTSEYFALGYKSVSNIVTNGDIQTINISNEYGLSTTESEYTQIRETQIYDNITSEQGNTTYKIPTPKFNVDAVLRDPILETSGTYTRATEEWVIANVSGGGIPDAPNDANAYVRSGLNWVIGYTKSAIDTLLGDKANLASPTFTGTPTAPTATLGTNTSQLATTAFVKQEINNVASIIKVISIDVSTNLATAQTISGLTQALDANSTYIVRGNIRNGCSGTGGVKFAVTLPTGTITVLQAAGQGGSTNTAIWPAHSAATSGLLQQAVSAFVTIAGTYFIEGTIRTGGTAGNLVFAFASTTAGQTSTIYTDGTYIEIIKIA